MTVDLKRYQEFVSSVTSDASNKTDTLAVRLNELAQLPNFNPALLLTAAIGMAAEGGEFAELPKKIIFQGKPFDEDTRFHMKRELGDIIWYWINACRALGLDPNEVIAENVNKLMSRYPGGQFDVHYSENRQQGDI
jgi:NTP pyrophosphatase (non-canonical NTP hydrolase)